LFEIVKKNEGGKSMYIGAFFIEHARRMKTNPFRMEMNDIHNAYEIYYLVTGERYYFIKDRTYHIKRGDLVFINRNELHKTSDCKGPAHERIITIFSHEFLQGLIDLKQEKDIFPIMNHSGYVFHLNIQQQQVVQSLFFKMLQENKNESLGFTKYIQMLLIELLLMIGRIYISNLRSKIEYSNHRHENITNIVEFINNHYFTRITLEQLSKQFFISANYLCKLFKKVTGFTLIDYLNWVRVSEAQLLLKQKHISISNIAIKVGYESSTHFGRVFKKLTGESPLQFRKLMEIAE
jgi:YesN/AraC family two-component response regulator